MLVMELCCADLAAAMEHACFRWDEALIRALLRQLLRGAAACHQAGPVIPILISPPSQLCIIS